MSDETTRQQSYDGSPVASTEGLRVAVLGLGRAGAALARELHGAGVELVALWNRSDRAVPAELAGLPVAFGGEAPPPALISGANVLLLAVHDSAIAPLAAALDPAPGTTLLHLSGALAASALGPLRADLHGGCYHPLQSFRPGQRPAFPLPPYCLALDGDDRALEVGRSLAAATDHPSVQVDAEGKAAYHAAAVMTSGCMVALLSAATQALDSAGIPEDQRWSLLWPLAVGTLANLEDGDFPGSLTGPVARGDAETARRNLEALAAQPDIARIYRLLGQQALRLAAEAGLAPERREETLTVLEDGDGVEENAP